MTGVASGPIFWVAGGGGFFFYYLFCFVLPPTFHMGFPGGTVAKNSPANAGAARDSGSIPGLGRSPREENGNPYQYSCLENPTCLQKSLAAYSPKGHNEICHKTKCLHRSLPALTQLVMFSCSVISDSVTPLGRMEPTRLLCPWNFPAKNIEVDTTEY